MPDRLPLEATPKERLEQGAAILARAVRHYVRTNRVHLAVPSVPEKPPEFSPQGLLFSESPRLTMSWLR
jgi:hypothetical protein